MAVGGDAGDFGGCSRVRSAGAPAGQVYLPPFDPDQPRQHFGVFMLLISAVHRRVTMFLVRGSALLCALFLLAGQLTGGSAFANDPFSDDEAFEASEKKHSSSPRSRHLDYASDGEMSRENASHGIPSKVTVSFGPYSRRIRDLCEALRLDGREESLAVLMEANAVKDPHCPACFPFAKLVSSSCQPKKVVAKKSRKKLAEEAEGDEAVPAEPVVVPRTFRQREPSSLALQRAALLGTSLSEDEKRAAEAEKAIRFVRQLLDSNTAAPPGEKEYFDIFATYLEAPFLKAESTHRTAGEAQPRPEVSREELDALFE